MIKPKDDQEFLIETLVQMCTLLNSLDQLELKGYCVQNLKFKTKSLIKEIEFLFDKIWSNIPKEVKQQTEEAFYAYYSANYDILNCFMNMTHDEKIEFASKLKTT